MSDWQSDDSNSNSDFDWDIEEDEDEKSTSNIEKDKTTNIEEDCTTTPEKTTDILKNIDTINNSKVKLEKLERFQENIL